MRLHGDVSDDEEEDAVMDPALLSLSSPNGAAVAAALAAPRLVVGYALTKKKVKSFLQPKLLLLARKKGISFVSIDETRPLSEQGPFDIILHKITGKEWQQVLEDYRELHPEVTVLDPPNAIEHLNNRQSMLEEVADLNLSSFYEEVCTPRQLVIMKDPSSIPTAVAVAGLTLPLVAKPLVVDGTSKSHELSLAYDEASLSMLDPPLVLQEFVNHGGILFKVYIIGEAIQVVRRFSVPDVNTYDLLNNVGIYRLPRVSCAAASADHADLDPRIAELPPRPLLEKLSRELRGRLGLRLFNVDMIRELGANDRYYIIDINYFPGYGKMPGYEHIFTDFLQTLGQNKYKRSVLSPPLPSPCYSTREAKREFPSVRRLADGRSAGPLPLRPPLRRWESGGTPDPCPRPVDSKVRGRVSVGAASVEMAAAAWNKCAGDRSPPRRRSVERCRRFSGVVSSRFGGSGEASCSEDRRRDGGGGWLPELLVPRPLLRLGVAPPGLAMGVLGVVRRGLVPGAGRLLCVYRRSFCGSSVVFVGFSVRSSGSSGWPWRCGLVGLRWRALLHPRRAPSFPAGRGGEGESCGLGGVSATAPASPSRVQCRERWKIGGFGAEAPWPYPFSVLRFRRLRRAASAAFFLSVVAPLRGWWWPGAFFSGAASAMKFFCRQCGCSAFGLAGFWRRCCAEFLGLYFAYSCAFISVLYLW